MNRLYACIADAHDLPMVILAGMLCIFSYYTAVSLIERGRAARSMTLIALSGVLPAGALILALIGLDIDRHLIKRDYIETERLQASGKRFQQLADATFEGVVMLRNGRIDGQRVDMVRA